MSKLTPEQILELIDKSGPNGLDLSGQDLEGIDLSFKKAAELAQKYGENLPKGLERFEDGTYYFCFTTIEGEELPYANLQGARLSGANLQGIELDHANLQEAELSGVDLQGARLSDANMQKAWLYGANLQGAHLSGADLRGALLMLANFRRADLEDSDLRKARLFGASLDGANLFGANLQGVIFFQKMLTDNNTRRTFIDMLEKPDIDPTLASIVAHGLVGDFIGVGLEEADLRYARLEGLDLARANLRGAFLFGTYLSGTRFGADQLKPKIGEEEDGRWYEAKESYLSLKNHFASQGRYDDARWAYVKERKMERKCFFPSTEGEREIKERLESLPEGNRRKTFGRVYNGWLYLKLFFRPKDIQIQRLSWLRNMLWELLCNYGESFFRPICWGLFIMLILSPPLLYGLGGIVADGSPASYADCIIFSMRSFATLSFTDIASLNYFGKVWSCLEAMAGVMTFALIIYTVGRRLAGV